MDAYEKKYKEALERAREFVCKNNVEVAEYIFPELSESEDEKPNSERIRKAIICGMNALKDQKVETFATIPIDDCIAWLEKQGEQKPILPKWKYKNDNTPLLRDSIILNKYGCVAKSPSGALVSDVWVLDYDELAKLPKEEIEKQGEQKPDKVEPKFKVGDFIVNDYCMGRIVEITNDAYLLDTEQGIPFSCHSTRLWDITKDAKDGDVLVCESGKRTLECLFIFKLIADREVHEYCSYRTIDKHFSLKDSFLGYVDNVYHPATKEQRDQLEKAITNAGYTFDFEKKELKKIEQKSNNNQFTPEQASVLDKHIDKLIEQKPATDFSDLRTWKYIVDAVCTEKEGIGQYLDSPFTEEVAKKLQKRFGNIEQKSTDKATSTTFSYITPNQKFFQWIYDRLVYVHNENPDVDYMRSLKERIEDMQNPFNYENATIVQKDFAPKSAMEAIKEEKVDAADKVESKFKIGDWISNGRYTKLIVGINSDWSHYMFNDGTSERIKDIDKKYHLWTIADAKDGDVLALISGQSIFLFDGYDKEYCHYSKLTNSFSPNFNYIGFIQHQFVPATKEQRDTLERAMTNAGYRWNKEELKLEKI